MPDTTGILYTPHYLNVGDLLNEATWEATPWERMDLGDLLSALTRRRIFELAAENQSDDKPSRDIILTAVRDAEASIDSEISNFYEVPYKNSAGMVPATLLTMILDVFKYHLYSRKTVPNDILIMYRNTIEKAVRIGKGQARIPDYVITDGEIISKSTKSHVLSGDVVKGGFFHGNKPIM